MREQSKGKGALECNRRLPRHLRNEDIPTDTFTPRTYQVDLVDASLQRNTIVCLGSSSTKTFIALMAIKEMAHQVLHSHRRTAYLVLSEAAAEYHGQVLQQHTDLHVRLHLAPEPGLGTGWLEEMQSAHIHIFLAPTFVASLQDCPQLLSHLNLLVVDDCHEAVGTHPYTTIMQCYHRLEKDRPHVLGISASLVGARCSDPQELQATIQGLEEMLQARAETAMLVISERYGCHPQEELVVCPAECPALRLSQLLESILECARDFLSSCQFSREFEESGGRDPTTEPLNAISETQCILEALGPWCASKIAEILVSHFEKMEKYETHDLHKKFIRYAATQLRMMTMQFEANFNISYDVQKLLEYASPKVGSLVEQVRRYKTSLDFQIINADSLGDGMSDEDDNDDSTDFSDDDSDDEEGSRSSKQIHIARMKEPDSPGPEGEKVVSTADLVEEKKMVSIVLVKRRFTAFILNKFIEEVCAWDEELCFVRSAYISGQGIRTAVGRKDASKSIRKQEETLRKFRMGEINLLISTNALEEGVDIPKCNLVIRFDVPEDYKSYTLSKGRARARDASYVILVDEDREEEFSTNLQTFKGIENVLLKRQPEEEEEEELEEEEEDPDSLIEPYPSDPTLPQVTMTTAIALVNRYCAKLPSDAFTHLTPQCRMTTVPTADIERPLHQAYLRLPINCPIKTEIQGQPMRSKKLAMMAVAMETCKQLHLKGELDENLQPVGKEMFLYEEEEEWEEEDVTGVQARPGTTKRKQYYFRKTADALVDSHPLPDTDCFLHVINMKLTGPITEEQNTRGRRIYAPQDTISSFGILSSKRIPQVPCFPVYTRSGEVTVSVDLQCQSVSLSEEKLEQLRQFHHFVFQRVLHLEKDPMEFNHSTANIGYLVVPIRLEDGGLEIQWDFVEAIYRNPNSKRRDIRKSVDVPFVFSKEDFEDAVVMPSYRNIDQPQHFYVAEIRYDLTPLSPFPSPELYRTFYQYYENKYGLMITNKDQPLLDVDHTSARLNLLTPRYMNQKGVALPTSSAETKRARRENLQQKQILVPELCDIHVFPASLWRKAVCLPAILYRLNFLLLAEEIRIKIAEETGIGKPVLPLKFRFPQLDFGFETNPEKLKLDSVDSRDQECGSSPDSGVETRAEEQDQECGSSPDSGVETRAEEQDQEGNSTGGLECRVGDTSGRQETEEAGPGEDINRKDSAPELLGAAGDRKGSDTSSSVDLDVEKSQVEVEGSRSKLGGEGGDVSSDSDSGIASSTKEGEGVPTADHSCSVCAASSTGERAESLQADHSQSPPDRSARPSGPSVSESRGGESPRKDSGVHLEAGELGCDSDQAVAKADDHASKEDVQVAEASADSAAPGCDQGHVQCADGAAKIAETAESQDDTSTEQPDLYSTSKNSPCHSASTTLQYSENEKPSVNSRLCTDPPNLALQDSGTQTSDISMPTNVHPQLQDSSAGDSPEAQSSSEEMMGGSHASLGTSKPEAASDLSVNQSGDNICNFGQSSQSELLCPPDVCDKCHKPYQVFHASVQAQSLPNISCKTKGAVSHLPQSSEPTSSHNSDPSETVGSTAEIKSHQSNSPPTKLALPEICVCDERKKTLNGKKALAPAVLDATEADAQSFSEDAANSKDAGGKEEKSNPAPEGGGGGAHGEDGEGRPSENSVLGEERLKVSLDKDLDLKTFMGPSPCLILQALTMSNANDFFSLERLETIGDSFLKYAITVYLYCTYPGIHEGKLSYLRSKQVSNYNLYRLGRRRGLAECMVSSKFEPYENWLPPGYIINEERRRGPVPRVVIANPQAVPKLRMAGLQPSPKLAQIPDGEDSSCKTLEESVSCEACEDDESSTSDGKSQENGQGSSGDDEILENDGAAQTGAEENIEEQENDSELNVSEREEKGLKNVDDQSESSPTNSSAVKEASAPEKPEEAKKSDGPAAKARTVLEKGNASQKSSEGCEPRIQLLWEREEESECRYKLDYMSLSQEVSVLERGTPAGESLANRRAEELEDLAAEAFVEVPLTMDTLAFGTAGGSTLTVGESSEWANYEKDLNRDDEGLTDGGKQSKMSDSTSNNSGQPWDKVEDSFATNEPLSGSATRSEAELQGRGLGQGWEGFHQDNNNPWVMEEQFSGTQHWSTADPEWKDFVPSVWSAESEEAVSRQRLQFESELEEVHKEVEEGSEEAVGEGQQLTPYSLQTQHGIPDKSVADCVEALIGCFLTTCGKKAALVFMASQGLKVLPRQPGGKEVEVVELQCPPSPLLAEQPEARAHLDHLLEGYEEFERQIGYQFRDRSYLLQAFTHASYLYNTITDCYQRLEFLGDAILDYVITRHLYEDSKKYSPGILTDLRSALVNNNIFAALAVKWNFHKYFKSISPSLFYVIEKFVARQKEKEDEVDLDEGLDEDFVESQELELEIPKALGDIFESVAGAIYLDSGMSLDTVWRVYFRMMQPLIDKYLKSIPKSPVRELLEQEPETAKFEKPERTMDGKIRVTVNVVGKGEFSGIGRNYRIAKSAAAKKALRHLRALASLSHGDDAFSLKDE